MNKTLWSTIILVARCWLLAGNWAWNKDTVVAIIPGLQCWYCTSWQAPYGILWHIASMPALMFVNRWPFQQFTLYMTLIDFAVMLLLRQTRILWPTYAIFSFWIFLQAPWDLPILWFTVTGVYAWPLAFLGAVAKLPIGSELWGFTTWNFVLHKPYLASDYQYYSFMGFVFIATIFEYRIRRRRLRAVQSQSSSRLSNLSHRGHRRIMA